VAARQVFVILPPMRIRLALLLLCLTLLGCPIGPQPSDNSGQNGEQPGAKAAPEIKQVSPTAEESQLTLDSPLETGDRRSRYSKIQMNYRIVTSELEGFAGRKYARSKEESFSAEVLRPGTIRRHYQMSTNKVVASKDGKELARQVNQTALHGKRVTLQTGGGNGLAVWDESGPLDAQTTRQMVFDLISLKQLVPPSAVQLGQSWQAPPSLIPHILGATETGRKISGTIRCTLEGLVELGGVRAARISLQVEVTMVDHRVVQDQIEYQMTTRLSLAGTYYHALSAQRPLKLTLQGKALLDHKPLRVDFIPPGTEALTKPFHAEGTMNILLRFP